MQIFLTILVWLAVVVAFLYYRIRLRHELSAKAAESRQLNSRGAQPPRLQFGAPSRRTRAHRTVG